MYSTLKQLAAVPAISVIGHQEDATPVALAIDKLIGKHTMIAATTGAGKSYCTRKFLEIVMAGRIPTIIFDCEGEYASIRSAAPNDLIMFGSGGSDIPLERERFKEQVLIILDARASVVVDMAGLDEEEQCEIVASFIGALMQAPRHLWGPYLIAIDEVQRFAPERGSPPSRAAIGSLARQGRKRGFMLLAASQRIAEVSKALTTQAAHRLVGQVKSPTDRDRIEREMGLTKDQAAMLPSLEAGQFFVDGPALARMPTLLKIAATVSRHSSEADILTALDKPVLPIAQVVRRLRRAAPEGEAPSADAEPTALAADPVIVQLDDRRATRSRKRDCATKTRIPMVDDLAAEILAILSESPRGRSTRDAIALLTGRAATGAELMQAFADLLGARMIDLRSSTAVHLTRAGRNLIAEHGITGSNLAERAAAKRAVLGRLEGRALDALLAAYPQRLTVAEIALRTGTTKRSRNLRSALSRLSRGGLTRKTGDTYFASRAFATLFGN